MMDDFDLVVSGGVLVPMTARRKWFPADVAVVDGEIVAVEQPGFFDDRHVEIRVDASDALVVPGFVQSHVHVIQALLRHQADDLPLLDWLRTKTWPYEAALDGDGVAAAAQLGIAELLTGGTTTVLDFGTTHDHDRVFQAAERIGIRLLSGKTHMDRGEGAPEGLLEDPDTSLAEADTLGQRWHGAADGRLSYTVVPRFALSCSRELLEGCVSLARRRGWLLSTHAAENRDEVDAVKSLYGYDNVRLLHDFGLTGPDVVLVHGVHLNGGEIELMADTGTGLCHCPGANLKLGSGIADVPRLLKAGVRVGLGSDGAPCNNRMSMFHEMALAATLHSLEHGPQAMDAWTVLDMATRGGAQLIGMGDRIGTIEVGKRADLAVVDLGGWSMLPDGDPAARLAYGGTAQDVRHVVVDGRAVVVDRHMTTVDPEIVRESAQSAWAATWARMKEAHR